MEITGTPALTPFWLKTQKRGTKSLTAQSNKPHKLKKPVYNDQIPLFSLPVDNAIDTDFKKSIMDL